MQFFSVFIVISQYISRPLDLLFVLTILQYQSYFDLFFQFKSHFFIFFHLFKLSISRFFMLVNLHHLSLILYFKNLIHVKSRFFILYSLILRDPLIKFLVFLIIQLALLLQVETYEFTVSKQHQQLNEVFILSLLIIQFDIF